MVRDSTLYDRLKIPSDASESQIKRAYIQLSKIWHPDKHSDEKKEEASQKFKEISEAYQVLSDPQKKEIYDIYYKKGFRGRLLSDIVKKITSNKKIWKNIIDYPIQKH